MTSVRSKTIASPHRLKEIDLAIWMQVNDCLLPILCFSNSESVATRLAFASLRANLFHLYIKQSLDGLLHVKLVRFAMNLERILVVSNRPVNTFFSDQRSQQNLMRLKLAASRLRRWSLYFSHRYQLPTIDVTNKFTTYIRPRVATSDLEPRPLNGRERFRKRTILNLVQRVFSNHHSASLQH
jgi:hypothetical protein